MTFNLVAVVYPKEGKLERVKELGKEISAWVEANEPNTLQYHWSTSKEDDKPIIVLQEIYADEAAFNAHKESPKFGWLIETATKEDLFAAPIKILFLEPFTGFAGPSSVLREAWVAKARRWDKKVVHWVGAVNFFTQESRKSCYIEKDEQRGTNGGSREKSLPAKRISLVTEVPVTELAATALITSHRDHIAFKDTAGSTMQSPDACSRGSFKCGASGSGSGESRVLAITVPFQTGEWNPKKPNPGVNSNRKVPLGTLGFSRPSTGSRNGEMQSRVAPNEVIGRVIVQFNSPCQ
ncbi:uncharacterized protein B0T23DRAFT_400525 [Neurospora hispaniola]|uniref:ABM domain-containing protein n=1 Tax=Neurospora hispaniola TaxID=588809 RepID=A0AAJ0MV06_9PEZI|nr:hypothetical protein B0T23DRAFT_400525 [Neurospora hispaniola]